MAITIYSLINFENEGFRRFHEYFCSLVVWKLLKFTVTEKISREIKFLVTSLIISEDATFTKFLIKKYDGFPQFRHCIYTVW